MPSFLNFRALLSRHRRRRQHSHQAPDQDTIIPDEFIRPSRLSQNYMRFNARKPASGRTVLQTSPYTGELISYANSGLVEVEEVKGTMESEAVRSLAARVPPELFEDILFYINVDRASQRKYESGNHLERNRGEPSPDDILTDLKQCSLVCLFWANRCRDHMFAGRTLEIKSYEDAEILRRYAVQGCPRLTLVHPLISKIVVHQDYESGRSFLHLLHLLIIQDKLDSISINGPIPDGFNPAKLDTPHWSIPPSSIVLPSSFLQGRISISYLHLPSFYHVTKYIRHFAYAAYIEFKRITWDGQTPISLPQASSTIICRHRPGPHTMIVAVQGVCTDSVHLALTTLMLNPYCPLHRLSGEEHLWMMKFLTLLCGHEKDPSVYIVFNVSEQTTAMRLGRFHFAFEDASASVDRSASALSVVGTCAYIYDDGLPLNLDALVNYARTRPTIRALVLLFASLEFLQVSVKPFVQVLVRAAETIELVLAYEEEQKQEERRAVGVDLTTLEPNGRIATWDDEQLEYCWAGQLSLQMLQRQLKKKRWMSVY